MDLSTQNILLIITFGDQSWVVLTNGTWQPIIDDFMVPDGVTQYTVQLKDISTQDGDIYVYINDGWLEVPNSVVQSVRQEREPDNDDSQESITPLDPAQQGDSFFFHTVQRTGNEIIAKSGFDSTATSTPSTSINPSPQSSDNFAAITVEVIEVCSPDGEMYNISGDVDDVEDGNTVSITVTDTEGNNKTFLTLVIDGSWEVPNADLSGLVDGQLIVVANTTDDAGNPATATTDFIKDTLAEITISVDTGVDDVINVDEANAVNISGNVIGVEDEQTITLTVTDGINTLTFTSIITSGAWLVENADLSSLNDGDLNYTATVTDHNCNNAEATTVKGKDTQATITIDVDTELDTVDDVINKVESLTVAISGTVIDVEDNQIVTLSVTDGITTLSFTTTVISSTWQVNDADLSSLIDGTLTYSVNVSDISGNPATAETTTLKDTQAAVTIVVDTNLDTPDNVINAVERTQVDIYPSHFKMQGKTFESCH